MQSTKRQSLAATSKVESYSKVKAALETGPKTRSQLSALTGLKLSSVCGRCNELLKLGQVQVVGRAWDSETSRNVELLQLTRSLT
jgi:hypothetical protein